MATLIRRAENRARRKEFQESPAVEEPLREELLSIDLLKQHAYSLAQERRVMNGRGRGPDLLLPRLASNEILLRDYNVRTLEVEKNRRITPAAEWLLDNFHLIEDQIRTAQRHLPRGFNRQLPLLLNGPWKQFPRVYEIALELVSHTDGRIDALHLASFVTGYQEVVPLHLGELWAIPIMLRLALIENLRRVAVRLNVGRKDRDRADDWAARLLETAEANPSRLIIVVGEMARMHPLLRREFASEILQRLQEKSPPVKLAINWIEERLAEDGLTIEQLLQTESQHQAATQVSVGNCIGSLRLLDTLDWRKFVEEQSVVERTMRDDPAGIYPKMNFATRDLYRHTVERIARCSKKKEPEVAALALGLAQKNDRRDDDRLAHVGFFLIGKGIHLLERAAEIKIPLRQILPRIARRNPLLFYLGSVIGISVLAAILVLHWVMAVGTTGWVFCLLAWLTLLCTSQLGVSLVNWCATLFVKPSPLPRLDFSKGIPSEHTTLVVVPTLLSRVSGIENLMEALEVRYLANRDNQVFFALLTDFCDAPEEHQMADRELLDHAANGIRDLNQKYRPDRPCVFFLFHRPRRWNDREQVWMGYERKRGKLADLNHFLRGGSGE